MANDRERERAREERQNDIERSIRRCEVDRTRATKTLQRVLVANRGRSFRLEPWLLQDRVLLPRGIQRKQRLSINQ